MRAGPSPWRRATAAGSIRTWTTATSTPIAYFGASKYFTVDLRVRYQIDKRWSAAFGIDNANNYQYWNFHPYPQRTYSAELRFDL